MTTNITRQQFLQALRDHPDWREEIRAQILGEELMRLPAAFQAFVAGQQKFNDEMRASRDSQEAFNDEMRVSRDSQEAFNDEMREFRDSQEAFNDEMREFRNETLRRFDNIDRRLDRMENDSSWLKNFSTEFRAERDTLAICLAAGCEPGRVLTTAEVNDIATSLSGGEVTSGDRISFARADLIIEADLAGETVYLAVEISYTAAERDQRRAQRNAQYLADHTGCPGFPLVAGVRHDDELRPAIDRGDIIWVELEEP